MKGKTPKPVGHMDKEAFTSHLTELASGMGLSVSPHQAELFHAHIDLLLQWNRTTNLTRITRWDEILEKHILDSIAPAQWLPEKGYALDVGTGGGFPGVPLKIFRPGLRMVLLESHRKKTSFLRVLLSKLALDGILAMQGRWENIKEIPSASTHAYALITMRAVRLESAHLNLLAEGALGEGGAFAFWAGPETEPEWRRVIEASPPGHLHFEGAFPYTLPSASSSPRHLLVWRKVRREAA